jgi:protein-arginine kinase activator protein McsA
MDPLTIACPACGFPETRLRHSLALGCPVCYETFAPHLSTFLPKLHTGTHHIGKTPEARTLEEIIQRIENLAARIAEQAPDSPESRILQTLQNKIPNSPSPTHRTTLLPRP